MQHDERVVEAVARAGHERYWRGTRLWSDILEHDDDDWREATRAALDAAEKVRWRPIETAPRDGAMVLLAHDTLDGQETSYGYWTGRAWWMATWREECLDKDALKHGVGGFDFRAFAIEPTHVREPPRPAGRERAVSKYVVVWCYVTGCQSRSEPLTKRQAEMVAKTVNDALGLGTYCNATAYIELVDKE